MVDFENLDRQPDAQGDPVGTLGDLVDEMQQLLAMPKDVSDRNILLVGKRMLENARTIRRIRRSAGMPEPENSFPEDELEEAIDKRDYDMIKMILIGES
jgi:hypothetical protein